MGVAAGPVAMDLSGAGWSEDRVRVPETRTPITERRDPVRFPVVGRSSRRHQWGVARPISQSAR
jgi:hypothetical protein